MNHRSPTNSHHERNEPLRTEYLERWPYDQAWRYVCEVEPYLRRKRFFAAHAGIDVSDAYRLIDATEVHHIHGSRKGRWDLWSNFISVSRRTHEWLESNGNLALIVCLYAKFDLWRTGNKEHFDIGELRVSSGYNYPDYIETLTVNNERVAAMRDEIVAAFVKSPKIFQRRKTE